MCTELTTLFNILSMNLTKNKKNKNKNKKTSLWAGQRLFDPQPSSLRCSAVVSVDGTSSFSVMFKV